MTCRSLRHIKHPSQINGDDTIPLLGRDIEKLVPNADPGIVDQDIDTVHKSDGLGKRRFHLHEISDVSDDRLSQSGQLMLDACTSRLIAIKHAYPRAFFQKARSSRRANA